MSEGERNPWVLVPMHRPDAAVRLFCLPHAGGGAAAYRAWPARFPRDVEVCLVQLPGRESRIFEQPRDSMDALVADLAEHLRPLLDRRYVLFGHSMGALAAFEFARHARATGLPVPDALYVSGHRAPHVDRPGRHRRDLPDEELVAELREMGGFDEELLAQRAFLDLVLPTIRADLSVAETHVWTGGEPLDCPIVAFGGTEDAMVTEDDVTGWRQHTTGAFRSRMFPGGHFFLHEDQESVIGEVVRDIGRVRSAL